MENRFGKMVWLEETLDVSLPEPDPDELTALLDPDADDAEDDTLDDIPAQATAVWQAAREAVDEQISSLREALRGYADPTLDRIAEFGLNGVTGRLQVGLQVALFEFVSAAPANEARAAAAVLSAAQAYAGFVAEDPTIALADRCPVAPTNIRSTLTPALAELTKLVGRAA